MSFESENEYQASIWKDTLMNAIIVFYKECVCTSYIKNMYIYIYIHIFKKKEISWQEKAIVNMEQDKSSCITYNEYYYYIHHGVWIYRYCIII